MSLLAYDVSTIWSFKPMAHPPKHQLPTDGISAIRYNCPNGHLPTNKFTHRHFNKPTLLSTTIHFLILGSYSKWRACCSFDTISPPPYDQLAILFIHATTFLKDGVSTIHISAHCNIRPLVPRPTIDYYHRDFRLKIFILQHFAPWSYWIESLAVIAKFH